MTAKKTRTKAKPARKRAAKATEPALYKILVRGQSCHGGTLTWSLPSARKPGAWHEVDGALELCRRGIHVTRASGVARWVSACLDNGTALSDVEIYECEASAERTEYSESDGGKLAARAVRLMRRVTEETGLAVLGIYTSGSHDLTTGCAVASGSASVRASGSASVSAYGSASVRASDSASVSAYDSASVSAQRAATVIRWATAVRVSTTERAVLVDRSGGYDAPAVTYSTPHSTHPDAPR